jgi:predicted RecB family endonuclease
MTTTFTPMSDDAVTALAKSITLGNSNFAVVGSPRAADGIQRAADSLGIKITILVDDGLRQDSFLLMHKTDLRKIEPVVEVLDKQEETDEDWYNKVWAAEDAADLADAMAEKDSEADDDERGVWDRMMEKYRD